MIDSIKVSSEKYIRITISEQKANRIAEWLRNHNNGSQDIEDLYYALLNDVKR
jgi:hypothetical protein